MTVAVATNRRRQGFGGQACVPPDATNNRRLSVVRAVHEAT